MRKAEDDDNCFFYFNRSLGETFSKIGNKIWIFYFFFKFQLESSWREDDYNDDYNDPRLDGAGVGPVSVCRFRNKKYIFFFK